MGAGRRDARIAAGTAVGIVGVEIGLQLLDFEALGLRVKWLDSAQETSYSHMAATVAFGTATAACVYGGLRDVAPRRRLWRVAGVLFGVLLADNVTRLHESIHPWGAVYAPLLCGLGAAVLLLARGTDQQTFVVAGLGLLAGSLLIHIFGLSVVEALGWTQDSVAYQIKVAVKEGTELAGWVLVAPALVRLARHSGRGAIHRARSGARVGV